MTHADLERRDVHLFSINEDVSVTDQLPRLIVGGGKAQTQDHVVEPPLELGEEVFARDALLASRLLEIRAELVLENAIDAFYFLFFAELQAVPDDLRPAVVAMLSRREIPLFD